MLTVTGSQSINYVRKLTEQQQVQVKMSTDFNTGLSLLSRGIGEERGRSGHRKLEVCLEPQVIIGV